MVITRGMAAPGGSARGLTALFGADLISTLLAPRGTMLAADAARALLVAAIPVLDLLGALPLSIIVGIAFLLGGFFPRTPPRSAWFSRSSRVRTSCG